MIALYPYFTCGEAVSRWISRHVSSETTLSLLVWLACPLLFIVAPTTFLVETVRTSFRYFFHRIIGTLTECWLALAETFEDVGWWFKSRSGRISGVSALWFHRSVDCQFSVRSDISTLGRCPGRSARESCSRGCRLISGWWLRLRGKHHHRYRFQVFQISQVYDLVV